MTQLYKDHADRFKPIRKLLLERANPLAAMRAVQQIATDQRCGHRPFHRSFATLDIGRSFTMQAGIILAQLLKTAGSLGMDHPQRRLITTGCCHISETCPMFALCLRCAAVALQPPAQMHCCA